MKNVITYTDVHGHLRRLEKHSPGPFIQWHKKLPPCVSTRWRTEDGSIIQIPDAAWAYYKIDFELKTC